ncbi:hypothetical protein ACKAV7_008468 [Fusarium commune]
MKFKTLGLFGGLATISSTKVLDTGFLNVKTAIPGDYGVAATPSIWLTARDQCDTGTVYTSTKNGQEQLTWKDTVGDFCDVSPNWFDQSVVMDDGSTISFNGCSRGNYINVVWKTSDGRTYQDQCKQTLIQCQNNGNYADGFTYRCGNFPA